MAHFNTYRLKVSFRVYGKHWNLLTKEQREHVDSIVYDHY